MNDFEIKAIDLTDSKPTNQRFFSECREAGVINNSSIGSMKLGRFPNEKWFGAIVDGELAAVSGCYPSDEFEQNGWRTLFRSVTLPKYRSRAGKFSRSLNHEFCFGHILPYQIQFARSRGGRFFYFSTNSLGSGDSKSNRTNRFVESVLLKLGLVEEYERNIEYYGCTQNIWKLTEKVDSLKSSPISSV